jgi:hypothetical protein
VTADPTSDSADTNFQRRNPFAVGQVIDTMRALAGQ